MGFPRQEYQNELSFPSPGDLPDPGIEPGSPTLQVDSSLPEPPGKPGPKPLDKYSSWSLKEKLSPETSKSPKEPWLALVRSCAYSEPITVSREIRFSDLSLAPPLWWNRTLDGPTRQNQNEGVRVIPLRNDLGKDKLTDDHYWWPRY